MSVWKDIDKLAKRLLGASSDGPVDLSKIDRALAPKGASGRKGRSKAPSDIPEVIEELPEYTFVLEAIRQGCPAIFITGRAGTGKSTLIRFLSGKIKNCAVVAPTALAAINVQGTTIHSFFGIPPRTLNPDEVAKPRRPMIPVIETLDALIIDEVSMVSPDLVDCINNTLKMVRRDARPFGGVPLIFVGDLLQLPPVIADPEVARFFTDRYKSPNFFSADVFKETPLIPIELTKVFRQSGSEFIDLLDRIRLNVDHRDAVARLNRECFRDRAPDTEPSLFLVPTNRAAKGINTRNLNSLDTDLHVFEAVVDGQFNISTDRFQAPHRLELKEGAQLLFVKNKKPYWVNGSLGQVTHIDSNIIRVELKDSGNIVNVERETWEKLEYHYDTEKQRIISKVVGSFKQFPVTLGWAITIHKSQGMTLDSVRIDLGNGAFCTGQTYVALSRCRTLEGIALDRPIAMRDVNADQSILKFYAQLSPLRNLKGSNLVPDNTDK